MAQGTTITRLWSPAQVAAAHICLIRQLELWEAQRRLEIELGDEEGTLDVADTLSHFSAGLDQPHTVGAKEARGFLEALSQ